MVPPYILTHDVDLTTLIHKIIVSIVASAHELTYDIVPCGVIVLMKVFHGVGTTTKLCLSPPDPETDNSQKHKR